MMNAAAQRFPPRGAASPSSVRRVAMREAQPCAASDEHAFEPAADIEVEAHQRGEAPARQPLDRGADQAAAHRSGDDQREGPLL